MDITPSRHGGAHARPSLRTDGTHAKPVSRRHSAAHGRNVRTSGAAHTAAHRAPVSAQRMSNTRRRQPGVPDGVALATAGRPSHRCHSR